MTHNDTLFINNLRLPARIGIHPHERQAPQNIIISLDVTVHHITDSAINDISDIVCYEKLANKITDIINQGHIDLVETLAEKITHAILTDKRINHIRLRIEKPDALTNADSAGIEIQRQQPAIS